MDTLGLWEVKKPVLISLSWLHLTASPLSVQELCLLHVSAVSMQSVAQVGIIANTLRQSPLTGISGVGFRYIQVGAIVWLPVLENYNKYYSSFSSDIGECGGRGFERLFGSLTSLLFVEY